MTTTTEKWPLTSDRELDVLVRHLHSLDETVFERYVAEIITQLRARLAEAEKDRDRYRAAFVEIEDIAMNHSDSIDAIIDVLGVARKALEGGDDDDRTV